jgi:tRNA(Ile)-lysidine synthase
MRRPLGLYARWSLEMRRKEFFRAGQRVGVAISGGPDSVLLLHFMNALARQVGLTLTAVHFNHHLRGAESDGDEAFVRDLAALLQMEYLQGEAEVGRVARERRGNLEAVARELRYRYFFSLVDQGRLDLVATAHTANDQAETVLLRLLRGTGTRGLGGIYPVLEGKVVRPFLSLTRTEVMEEIAARRLSYRVDSSNLNTRLQRNKVRLELLPLLAKEYNPEVITLLNHLAERARDDEACLERLARDRAHPWRMREGREERIPIRALLDFPPALARRVLRQMLQTVRGPTHGPAHDHIEALRRFASEAQSGKIQTLPGGVVARKEFSWLVVGPTISERAGREFTYPVTFPGEWPVPEAGCLFRFKILNRDDPGKAYNLDAYKGLDPQQLQGELLLRNWRAGDIFHPVGSRGIRKLKELFRERKIPEVQRHCWPVLLCAGQIVWVRGFPPGSSVAATNRTQQVLVVEEEAMRPSPAARKRSI